VDAEEFLDVTAGVCDFLPDNLYFPVKEEMGHLLEEVGQELWKMQAGGNGCSVNGKENH
jgi:hypothetical protein